MHSLRHTWTDGRTDGRIQSLFVVVADRCAYGTYTHRERESETRKVEKKLSCAVGAHDGPHRTADTPTAGRGSNQPPTVLCVRCRDGRGCTRTLQWYKQTYKHTNIPSPHCLTHKLTQPSRINRNHTASSSSSLSLFLPTPCCCCCCCWSIVSIFGSFSTRYEPSTPLGGVFSS